MLDTDTSPAASGAEFAAELQCRLHALVRAYGLCDRTCLEGCGITVAQSTTLLTLPDTGSVSMNELSQAMGLASCTMTRVVDELVRKELAGRRPDDDDRRIVRVGLTDCGRQAQRQIRGVLDQAFASVIEEISPDSRDVLLRVLSQLTEALRAVASRDC